jgi:MFS family permease
VRDVEQDTRTDDAVFGDGLDAATVQPPWWSRGRVAVGSLIFAGSGLIVLLSTPSPDVIYGAIAVTSFGMWSYVPTIQAYLLDMFSTESLGGDFGSLKAVYTGLGSLGPTSAGMVAERTNHIVAFAGFVLCLFVAAAVI